MDEAGRKDEEEMSEKSTPATAELKRLLDGLTEHGGAHLDEIGADLAQTRLLLAEAIARLGGCFEAMCAEIARQREILQQAGAAAPDVSELSDSTRASLLACIAGIETQTRAMVTALQFEDMTSQLIAHSERRLAGLRDMLSGLGSGAQGLGEGGEGTLETMHATLAARSRELSGTLCKSVGQRHLDSGDMELF
jgi:hypothetical protein